MKIAEQACEAQPRPGDLGDTMKIAEQACEAQPRLGDLGDTMKIAEQACEAQPRPGDLGDTYRRPISRRRCMRKSCDVIGAYFSPRPL